MQDAKGVKDDMISDCVILERDLMLSIDISSGANREAGKGKIRQNRLLPGRGNDRPTGRDARMPIITFSAIVPCDMELQRKRDQRDAG